MLGDILFVVGLYMIAIAGYIVTFKFDKLRESAKWLWAWCAIFLAGFVLGVAGATMNSKLAMHLRSMLGLNV